MTQSIVSAWVVYHIASGQVFFSGVGLILAGVVLATRPPGRWRGGLRTILGCVGVVLVAVSSTPLPEWLDVVGGLIVPAWIGFEGANDHQFRDVKVQLRFAVLVWCGVGLVLEAPYHVWARVPAMGESSLFIVGDSLGAGVGGEADTWPRLLARTHGIGVTDLSRSGARVATALEQADRVPPGALVLVEIGGNDLLGDTTAREFEVGLDALLGTLCLDDRTVVMLELPLPPFSNRYAAIQRRMAREYGVILVPKRVLIGVLTSRGATLDTVHLSPRGHTLMAETIWRILKPAFDRPS